jgi:hypothetical protein
MSDSIKGKEAETTLFSLSTASHESRQSISNPQIDVLKRRREDLLRIHPEVAESEQLRRDIERLEREAHNAKHHPHDKDGEKAKNKGGGVKFLTRPKLRGYFHRTQLYKSRGDNEYAATTSISLFTDLLFVGVLAETGGLAVVDSNPINLLRFIVQFLPSWRIWCYVRDIVAMYEMNAVSQRFLILWILCMLIGFTVKSAPFMMF